MSSHSRDSDDTDLAADDPSEDDISISESLPLPFVKGSDTSFEAAESKKSQAATDRERAMVFIEARTKMLDENGDPLGATADEVWMIVGEGRATSCWSARVTELAHKFGRIKKTGRKRKTSKGRMAHVYIACDLDLPKKPGIPKPNRATVRMALFELHKVYEHWLDDDGEHFYNLEALWRWERSKLLDGR